MGGKALIISSLIILMFLEVRTGKEDCKLDIENPNFLDEGRRKFARPIDHSCNFTS